MKLLTKLGLMSLMAGATATAVYGDPPGGWLSPSGAGLSGGASATAGSAAVDLHLTTSVAEMRARIPLLHEQSRIDARHIMHLQQRAREEKSVIKLNCINDKLVQLKAQMNIQDAKELELEAAHDVDRNVVFEAVVQAADNIRRLREESDQCIGEPVTFGGGESSNSFTGPTATDDPTKGGKGGGGLSRDPLEPPTYASPFD
jgi:hypothetical protein